MLGGPYWMRCVGTMLLSDTLKRICFKVSIPGSGGDLWLNPLRSSGVPRPASPPSSLRSASPYPAASWSGQPPAARPAAAARGTLRKITEDQRRRYQGWFDNARRLHRLVTELEALSIEALAEAE